MDILGKARQLETRLTRTLEQAVQGVVGPSARQPIEVLHAVVEAAGEQVQPAGRGRRLFPFNRMVVHLAAPTRAERARFEALTEQSPTLRDRIIDRLRGAGCDAGNLQLEIAYSPKARTGWTTAEYDIQFERVDAPPVSVAATDAPPPRIDLTVTTGSAARRTYAFTGGRIDIGRRAEVIDQQQRLLRTNHIAFADDEDESNKTVSRRHAHILYSAASRAYRLRDDGSAHGTAVVRDGHTIPVPQGTRGTRLQSGDEIVLGRAKLRVRIQ